MKIVNEIPRLFSIHNERRIRRVMIRFLTQTKIKKYSKHLLSDIISNIETYIKELEEGIVRHKKTIASNSYSWSNPKNLLKRSEQRLESAKKDLALAKSGTVPKGWEDCGNHDFDDLDGGMDEFPDCCGADVLDNFPYRESAEKLDAAADARLRLRINRLLKETPQKLIVAILNAPQQKTIGGIFKDFGGTMHVSAMGHHQHKIYLWSFVKSARARRKEKKVFGI